jgi:hypothetical protein
MFTELKLTDDLTIFTSTISNIDNELLVKDLEYNCDVSITYENEINSPGIQSKIEITSKNIIDIRNEILKKVLLHFKLDKNYLISQVDWVYISDNKNNQSNFHNHIGKENQPYLKEHAQWSIIYYVQMPNNLEGKDGHISFKTKNNEEISFLPAENQIIMFSADTLHKPELNKKSTNKRVVYATNLTILDRNKKYKKLNKTLL